MQTIITYDKNTHKIISAIQLNTIISEANLLKTPTVDVIITTAKDAIYLDSYNQMYLNEKYTK